MFSRLMSQNHVVHEKTMVFGVYEAKRKDYGSEEIFCLFGHIIECIPLSKVHALYLQEQ